MLTFLQYVSQFSLTVSQGFEIDGEDPIPLRLAIRKLWLHYGLETPDFKINGSPDRLNGQDLKKILIRLGIDSSIDPRLGWIASYPSLLVSIALFNPKAIDTAKNKESFFLRKDYGSIAWILEDSLSLLDNKDDRILSHKGLGSVVHAVYPLPRQGGIKPIEIKELSPIKDDYEKRFVGVSKRFSIKSRSIEPSNDHPYLRDQSQDKYLLSFSVKNAKAFCQLNLLFFPNARRVENKLTLAYLEFRSIDHKSGSRSAITIGELYVLPDNRFKIGFNDKIDKIADPIEIASIAKMLPLLGVNKTVKGNTVHGMADIHKDSQLMQSSVWLKVGISVTIAVNPSGSGKIWYDARNADRPRNAEKTRNRLIQSAPPIHWDPIGKSDPDPIKGANLPRSVAFPYDR